jgi:predicted transposase YdaD
LKNVIDTAKEEGFSEGQQKGYEQGYQEAEAKAAEKLRETEAERCATEQRLHQAVIKMLGKGLSVADVADFFNLPPDTVHVIQAKQTAEPS